MNQMVVSKETSQGNIHKWHPDFLLFLILLGLFAFDNSFLRLSLRFYFETPTFFAPAQICILRRPQKCGPSSTNYLTLLSNFKKGMEDGPSFCGLLRLFELKTGRPGQLWNLTQPNVIWNLDLRSASKCVVTFWPRPNIFKRSVHEANVFVVWVTRVDVSK